MNSWEEEYPLKQCESCIHNGVCKFVDMLSVPDLPIDLGDTTCDEYISEDEQGFSLDNMPVTDNRLYQFGVLDAPIEEPSNKIPIGDLEDDYATELLETIGYQILLFKQAGAKVKTVMLNESDIKRVQEACNTTETITFLQLSDNSIVDVECREDVAMGTVKYEFYR